MALSENPTVLQLKEVAEQHPNLEITRTDSLLAGNCEGGTDDFIEEYFKGRNSVKVSELLPYIDGFTGVRYVLEYKLRELEDEEGEPLAKPTEEPSEDTPKDEHPF